ncbi:hypothetical protein [Gymnodinialimonas hymeniacidonis]|uniref:hypothetical protein n=1 Tax=Gymnodinialimonas hymeniacidonis TaxID=3126508 RepID=UPI0034C5C454
MSERREPPLKAPERPVEAERPVLQGERRGDVPKGQRAGLWPVIFAIFGLVCLVVGAWDLVRGGGVNPALPPAVEAAEDVAVVTAGVYVSLRAINAALSAAQEVEVGASIGAQASLQPLKVLEPVDDTVERVADVVFAVAAGAALATVGLQPVAAIGLIVLGVGLVGYGFGRGSTARASLRAVRLGAALGLVLPLVFAGGVWLGEVATQAQWDTAMAELDAVAGEARVLIGAGEGDLVEAVEGGDGMISGFLSAITGARDSVAGYVEAAAVFTREADTLFSATLTIIGIFVLRVLVLPVLLLWSVMVLVRRSVE